MCAALRLLPKVNTGVFVVKGRVDTLAIITLTQLLRDITATSDANPLNLSVPTFQKIEV